MGRDSIFTVLRVQDFTANIFKVMFRIFITFTNRPRN